MAGDDSIRLPVTDFVREVALTAAREAASIAITEHISLCEARKQVLPNGNRPGLTTRVAMLEEAKDKTVPANPWKGFWVRVVQIVVAAAALAVAAWLLTTYRAQAGM